MVMHMLSEGMKTRRSLNPYPYLAFFNRPRMRNERFLLRDRKFSALSRLMVYMLAHKEARSSRAAANVKFDTEHDTIRPQSMNPLFALLMAANDQRSSKRSSIISTADVFGIATAIYSHSRSWESISVSLRPWIRETTM